MRKETLVPKSARPIPISLTHDEADVLKAPVGAGGQQGFHQMIVNQLQGGNLVVMLDDDELGKLIRYMTQYGQGGFQGRLRKAFQRPLRGLLG